MGKSHEILQLTKVRVLHLLREPEVVFWTFVFPVMLALVLGLAFSGKQEVVQRVAVLDHPDLEPWISALEEARHIELIRFQDVAEAEDYLRTGSVLALLEANPLTLRFDPTRPESDAARSAVEDVLQVAAGRSDPLAIAHLEEESRGSRYVDWLIPGLLGLNLMSTGIWGIGFAIVESRQKKLLKRFLVTPMKKSSFLLSYALSRLVFMILEIGAILLFAVWVLSVPMRGDLLTFVVLCIVGTLCFGGLAILIGSRAKSAEGVGGLIYLAFMPMGLSSGVFFSYENFSEKLQPIIKALPLTALNDALRLNMLEGAGLTQVMPYLGIQAVWGATCFALGMALFRWK